MLRRLTIVQDSVAGSTIAHLRTPRTREDAAVDLGRDASPHVESMENPQPLSGVQYASMSHMVHNDSMFPDQGEQRELPRVRGLPHHALDCTWNARKVNTLQTTFLDKEPILP